MVWDEAAERSEKLIKRFLIVIGAIIFVVIITLSYNILKSYTPKTIESCDFKIQEPELFDYNEEILNGNKAETILISYINENFTLLEQYFEDKCGGIAYHFNSTFNHYVVCTNGKIYNYTLVCGKDSFFSKARKFKNVILTQGNITNS